MSAGAPLPKAESLVLTSDEVNYLIYRYLQEGGEFYRAWGGVERGRSKGAWWREGETHLPRARPPSARPLSISLLPPLGVGTTVSAHA